MKIKITKKQPLKRLAEYRIRIRLPRLPKIKFGKSDKPAEELTGVELDDGGPTRVDVLPDAEGVPDVTLAAGDEGILDKIKQALSADITPDSWKYDPYRTRPDRPLTAAEKRERAEKEKRDLRSQEIGKRKDAERAERKKARRAEMGITESRISRIFLEELQAAVKNLPMETLERATGRLKRRQAMADDALEDESVEESAIDGAGGTGAGTHHAMAGVRFGRGRGAERERRSKSGLDPSIMDEADGADPRMGADMYTLVRKFSDRPERQSRGHTGGVHDVDDPGHPIFIYEDDEGY